MSDTSRTLSETDTPAWTIEAQSEEIARLQAENTALRAAAIPFLDALAEQEYRWSMALEGYPAQAVVRRSVTSNCETG